MSVGLLPSSQPKPAVKTAEEQDKWDKLWNQTLLKAAGLRKDYERHLNELYEMKG